MEGTRFEVELRNLARVKAFLKAEGITDKQGLE